MIIRDPWAAKRSSSATDRPFPAWIELSCKRIPSRKFASAAEFRQVYFKAPNELVEYELLAA